MAMPFSGIDVSPHWIVLPPWVKPEAAGHVDGVPLIRINPGAGFGIGTHETTQLCLLALAHLLRSGITLETVLDFGAGSGILAIGAALSGAHVEAVEIDERALENARENAQLNQVEPLIEFRTQLREPKRQFDLVVANILNQVLLEHAEALCARQSRQGRMILSGLVATDVPGIMARYRPLLVPMVGQIYERGEWRAVVFGG
jgi:ribosomal protein L11 methyltransferase